MKKQEKIVFSGFPVRIGFYEGKSSPKYPPFFYHREGEIQLFISGEGRYYIKGKTYNFKKNTVLIIHGNEPHRYLPHPDSFIKRYNLIFSDDIFISIPSALKIWKEMKKVYVISLSDVETVECQHLLDEISQEYKLQNEFWKEIITGNIQKIFIILKRVLYRKSDIQPLENPVVNKVLLYLETNYSGKISLKTVSKNFNISPFHLSRIFRKYTGFGFKEYLMHTRIAKAKDILQEEDIKISSVAYRVGFQDLSSFNKDFKELTGYTPSAYRNLFRKHKEVDYEREKY